MRTKHLAKTAAAVLVVVAAAAFAGTAQAAVKITKAEMNSTQLRLEGTALPNAVITVNSVAMGSSDSNGNFKIEKDPYTPPANCVVQVNDGSAAATSVTLAGCTPTLSSPPPPPPATAPALSKVTVNPSDVVGGGSATGTVTLTATAPVGGTQVALSSDDPAAATVPAGVTVPPGATSASFPIITNVVPNPQSALIIGTAGGVSTYAILTVDTPFSFAYGSISIVRGGNGNGTITSQPAGINCAITSAGGSGTCGAWFPVGTVVRLDARPAADSSFVGWTAGIGCGNPSKLTVQRDEFISCQPGFVLK
ncbi:MAG TPA: hypothetical protein VFM43_05780 [Gaiellaceae bacterium]|nr:hypothetical protein [Gaiellaceae bacterium]